MVMKIARIVTFGTVANVNGRKRGLVGNGRLFFFLSSLINKSGVSKMLILGLLR